MPTQQQILDNVKFHLTNIAEQKGKAIEITDDTVLSTVLSDSDGKGASNSKNVFRTVLGWTLQRAGVNKTWARTWMNSTASEFAGWFAAMLIFVFLLLSPAPARSQIQIDLGAAKTTLRDNAVIFGVQYLKSLDSLWGGQDFLITGKRSAFLITPDADIRFGTQDAFSSINVKATGLLITFQTTEVSGLVTPNTAKTFHTFPASFGAETNQLFNTVNLIAEVGWVPWIKANQFTRYVNAGVFLQAGYKIYIDSTGQSAKGGDRDESLEAPNETIFRAHGSFSIDSKQLISIGGFKLGLLGDAGAWYDIANGAFHHTIEGRARLYLGPLQYIDVIIRQNAGAPNFTRGTQYGAGFTFRL